MQGRVCEQGATGCGIGLKRRQHPWLSMQSPGEKKKKWNCSAVFNLQFCFFEQSPNKNPQYCECVLRASRVQFHFPLRRCFWVVDQIRQPSDTSHGTLHLAKSGQSQQPLACLLQEHSVVPLIGAVGIVVPSQLAQACHRQEPMTPTGLPALLDCRLSRDNA